MIGPQKGCFAALTNNLGRNPGIICRDDDLVDPVERDGELRRPADKSEATEALHVLAGNAFRSAARGNDSKHRGSL